MKQTAVEWLIEMYFSQNKALYGDEIIIAKEMEKQQIIEAYDEAEGKIIGRGEQYYNETFKQNKK